MQRSMVCLLLLVQRTNAKRMPVAVMPDNPNPDASRWDGTFSTHCSCWYHVTADLAAIHRTSTQHAGDSCPSSSQDPLRKAIHHDIVPAGVACHPTACTQAAGASAGLWPASQWRATRPGRYDGLFFRLPCKCPLRGSHVHGSWCLQETWQSSRAQARTTVGREFPVSALSIAERGPSPTIAHISCALSKIPSLIGSRAL